MKTVAVVQARLGSTRLPGKVMYPVGGLPVITRILRRLEPSTAIDQIVVATAEQQGNDVLATLAETEGVAAYMGSETDVLGRLYEAATAHNADCIVRVCADTPFVSHRIVDVCVRKLVEGNDDYVSTKLERTFPIGYGAEAFTMESFRRVETTSTEANEREHVTVKYREDGNGFSKANVAADTFFADERYHGRTELRLTLDRPADYKLIETVYSGMEASNPSIERVIDYIDANGLEHINSEVTQKSMYDVA